jgi:hypothetical protein
MLRKTYEFMMKYHMVFAALALLFSVIVSVRTVIRKNITSEMFIITSSGLLLIYFTIIHMILAPLSRYSIPLYPICYMLAIAALQYALIAGKRLFKNTKKVTI